MTYNKGSPPSRVVLVNPSDESDYSANPTGATTGNVAHDAADSGNPVKVGAFAHADPTAVTDVTNGDRVNVLANPEGQLYLCAGDYQGDGGGDGIPLIGLSARTGAAGLPKALAVGNYGFNGATWDRARGDTNGTVVQRALSSTFWQYAADAAGIVNTVVAVTIKAAAGAGVRNFLTSIQVSHDTLGAVTRLAVRDGAGGTVLWRGRLQTAATDASGGSGFIKFDPPLRGSANTLLEVLTEVAVTGAVFVSAQGYTGA